jgi:hypothetical protein
MVACTYDVSYKKESSSRGDSLSGQSTSSDFSASCTTLSLACSARSLRVISSALVPFSLSSTGFSSDLGFVFGASAFLSMSSVVS